MKLLEGKTAVITGASRGIGEGVALWSAGARGDAARGADRALRTAGHRGEACAPGCAQP